MAEKVIKNVTDIRQTSFDKLPAKDKKDLQDLSESLKEVTVSKRDWCYSYHPQEIFGQAIFDDFFGYNDNKYSFKFSDDFPEVGVLSQLEGFQFIAMLIENFGLDPKKYGDDLNGLLSDILDLVEKNGESHFDATPYLKDSTQFDGPCYLDTMTWFMSMVCSVIRLIKKDNKLVLAEDLKQRLFKHFRFCMKYITDNFIDGPENDNQKFSSGWNFTGVDKGDERKAKDYFEPSLYFTFAVSEVLIDIFSTFESTIREAETELVKDDIEAKLTGKADLEEIEDKKAQIESINKQNKLTPDEFKKEKDLFLQINNNHQPFDKDSLYALLEKQAKQAANNIWALVKDRLTEEFFAPNVVSTVSIDTIEQSITSDALFNNIFIINILMNAGIDEDKEDNINYYTKNGTSEYQKALDEYDEMRSTMRLGYDQVYQLYTNLKKENKDYKVNEYTLSFTENFSNDLLVRVQELRRAHIRVFSLMPLLVKTKTTMSEFVIRYPQYDMQLYLETILDNRYINKDGQKMWIWERDSYSTSSNYYFLSALNDFYGYYDEYELQYNPNAANNARETDRIQKEYHKFLKQEGQEIYNLEQSLKAEEEKNEALSQENERLNAEINNDTLRSALTSFVTKTIEKSISDMIAELFIREAESISDKGVNRAMVNHGQGEEEANEKGKFENSVGQLILSMLKEDMTEAVYKGYKGIKEDQVANEVAKVDKGVSRDIRNLLRLYLYQIYLGGDEGSSEFVATKGYKGIKDVLRKNEEDNNKKGY